MAVIHVSMKIYLYWSSCEKNSNRCFRGCRFWSHSVTYSRRNGLFCMRSSSCKSVFYLKLGIIHNWQWNASGLDLINLVICCQVSECHPYVDHIIVFF